jgi:hypothetical protein
MITLIYLMCASGLKFWTYCLAIGTVVYQKREIESRRWRTQYCKLKNLILTLLGVIFINFIFVTSSWETSARFGFQLKTKMHTWIEKCHLLIKWRSKLTMQKHICTRWYTKKYQYIATKSYVFSMPQKINRWI